MHTSKVQTIRCVADRLKVTQASAYYISRTAINCALFRGVYENLKFDGETMMHWCKREVRWGADWLLKTHVRAEKGNEGASKWKLGANGDKFVAMVRPTGINMQPESLNTSPEAETGLCNELRQACSQRHRWFRNS